MADVSVIIVAAGNSTRMNGLDKQFIEIDSMPVIAKTIKAFNDCEEVFEIIISTKESSIDKLNELCNEYNFYKVKNIVCGGDTRAKSVQNAFICVDNKAELVAIHDGARPLVKSDDIKNVFSNAKKYGASALCVPVKDTIKVSADGFIADTPDRSKLYAAQTPQVFKYEVYKKAIENIDPNVTDDCMAVENIGHKVHITVGDYQNIKITTPEDVLIADAICKGEKKMRIGSGYDVHKLVPDRKLILGGVEIPFELGLLGHSDADVLLHAISDALLGACALGDIGKHFPDNDPQYKNADSLVLLQKVGKLVKSKNYEIVNLDATVIAQKPKIAPHITAMRENIANALEIDIDCVSVKATTEEGLGFTGKLEGISANCVCLIK